MSESKYKQSVYKDWVVNLKTAIFPIFPDIEYLASVGFAIKSSDKSAVQCTCGYFSSGQDAAQSTCSFGRFEFEHPYDDKNADHVFDCACVLAVTFAKEKKRDELHRIIQWKPYLLAHLVN